jgi:DNA-directed RNA polymerase subunit RPC12/RpoP
MSGIITYQCPNCGGPLKFNPKLQKYACEYCLSEFTEGEAKEKEAEKKEAERVARETKESQGEPVLYSCPSCGAEVVTIR